MWFRLSWQAPSPGEYEFALDDLPVVIGRSKTVDLSLPCPLMSRRHCEFVASESGVCLRDLGSTNGTIVNAIFVDEHTLIDGDVIELGDLSLRVELSPGLKYQTDLNLIARETEAS